MADKTKFRFGMIAYDDLNELETDNLGRATMDESLIQIQIRKSLNGDLLCIGTITFHQNRNDYICMSVTGNSLKQKLIDIWEYTGISNFVLKMNYNNHQFYHVDMLYYLENGFEDQILDYEKFILDYPEYDLTQFKVNI
jgi:hypothetical protein